MAKRWPARHQLSSTTVKQIRLRNRFQLDFARKKGPGIDLMQRGLLSKVPLWHLIYTMPKA